MGKRRVNFQRCWLPVSRIGLHRRGVERVNCGPKLLDLGEKGVYSSYTSLPVSLAVILIRLNPSLSKCYWSAVNRVYWVMSRIAIWLNKDKMVTTTLKNTGAQQFITG